ncbi:MAG TPA: hypothetical protein DCR27_00090 [Lachnospiraceae bacterium]|nr:hypothetical protein [Lachnospiraceae bacterium]
MGRFIVAIEGGLGNQMFQYAFFLVLKEQYPLAELKVDLSLIDPRKHNGFELENVFGIVPECCDKREVLKYADYCPAAFPFSKLCNLYFAIRRRIVGRKKSFVKQMDATAYLPICFALDPLSNFYFKGVWANYMYFKNYKEMMQNIYTFPALCDSQNKKWQKMISNCNSVSIHFRGGDYYQEGFPVLSREYYQRAVAYMNCHVENPVFFVFTDDPENARKAIGDLANCHYVNNNKGKTSYIDMQLMSICKNNIAGNSTFSFWGSYLNKNENKIVISPKVKIKGCSNTYTCPDWILL